MIESPQELDKRAEVVIDETYSCKQYVNTAITCKKQADYYSLQGAIDLAFVNYMKHSQIIAKLRQHKGWKLFQKNEHAKYKEYVEMYHGLESLIPKMALYKEQLVKNYEQFILGQQQQQKENEKRQQQQQQVQENGMKMTKKTPDRITTQKLNDYLNWETPPKLLLLDIRPMNEFIEGHVRGLALCQISPDILDNCQSSSQIEKYLQGFHQVNFQNRHDYDLVIYMDRNSISTEQNGKLVKLVQLIHHDEIVKILTRTPALLVGGWEQWKATITSSPIRPRNGQKLIGFGNEDGFSIASASVEILRNSQEFLNQKGLMNGSFPDLTNGTQSMIYNQTFEDPFNHFVRDLNSSLDQSQSAKTSFYPEQTISSIPPALPPKDSGISPSPLSQPLVQPQPLSQLPAHLNRPLATVQPLGPKTVYRQTSTASTSSQPKRAPSPSSGVMMNTLFMEDVRLNQWSSVGKGFCGLKNLGNTCYMNSILQCLIATRPLSSIFYDGSFKKMLNQQNPLGAKGRLALAFSNLISTMIREDGGVSISPATFRETLTDFAPQFRGAEQHDSQEFLAFLLDGLHEDLNQGLGIKGGRGYSLTKAPSWVSRNDDEDEERYPEKINAERAWLKYLNRNDSLIVSLFQGQLKSQLKCSVCSKTSTTYNPFMYLSVPLPPRGSSIRLADCLNEFVKEEVLDEGDSWHCPRCKQPRKATKKLTISRLPKILLIHLKRFSFDGPFRDKLDHFVDFPIQGLDLFPYLSSSLQQDLVPYYQKQPIQPVQKYDLYAISNHYGGMNGGHYTAYVRQPNRRAWFHFDDTRVTELCQMGNSEMEQQMIKTKAAYSLFYVSWAAIQNVT